MTTPQTIHELRAKIHELTSKIEQAHQQGKPSINSAIWRVARDIHRKQLLKLKG